MGKMRDLTGQRFGKLTVIECAGKLDGRRYSWKCQCDCGNIIILQGIRLTSGNTKSCGCGKFDGFKKYNEQQSEENKIPVGTRFGSLIIIEDIGFIEQPGGNGRQRRGYRCQCDCGCQTIAMGYSLKAGQKISCGKCNLHSKGEYQIKTILDENNIPYLYDVPYEPLVQATKRRLRFDFIIYSDTNYTKPIRFIEFDGRQHYFGYDTEKYADTNSLKKIKERDEIKNNFCLSNNLALVRIPYTVTNITLTDILSDKYLIKGE